MSDKLRLYTERARAAALSVASLPTAVKNSVLTDLARLLVDSVGSVLSANAQDMAEAQDGGMEAAMLDRLLLSEERLAGIASDVQQVAALADPVGEEFDARLLPNGLEIHRQRVPLGVIGVVYESRPNVTIDVSILTLKSGNAVILRGGKEALRSNRALTALVREALSSNDVPIDTVQLIEETDRAIVGQMLRARGRIDLLVPRGGTGLIEYVRANAQIPVVTGGIGVCHTYVHEDADLAKALEIVDNAKTRRPTVCNALDTVLVHAAVAPSFLPALATRWHKKGVEMRCCPRAFSLLENATGGSTCVAAREDDFGREFLSLRAAVKVVDDLGEAIAHIERYGSGHSEAIVTEGYGSSRSFVSKVDAAAVYVNASTQFTDGAQFGLGAELGISTQKFHARGPLGLRELTSYKWVVLGDGQTRPL